MVFNNIGILQIKVDSVIEEEDSELANTLSRIFADLALGNLEQILINGSTEVPHLLIGLASVENIEC